MRNVNNEKLKDIVWKVKSFILTMRNVNASATFLADKEEVRFILTMRNVNYYKLILN